MIRINSLNCVCYDKKMETPACMEELKAAGIENFIHVRVNVLDTLKEYNAKLGIK